jgi:hypothetical protein
LLTVFGVTGAATAENNPLATTALAPAQVDRALDELFVRQKQLTHLQVQVLSRKEGGVFAGATASSYGMAYAQLPDLLYFIDYGANGESTPENQRAYVLIDGSYLWDMKNGETPGVFEAERIEMKNAGERDLSITALLIGAEVSNARELRQVYEVSGTLDDFGAAGKSYHFRFKTLPGKDAAAKDETTELWVKVGDVIPWRLKTTATVKKTDIFSGEVQLKNTVSEKEFSHAQTNLSQPPLAPFNVTQTFYIGSLLAKFRDTKVIANGGVLPHAQLINDLKILYSRLQEKQVRP